MTASHTQSRLSLLLGLACLVADSKSGSPAPVDTEPRIDHIEIVDELATIHFDTLPGRSYILQAASGLPASEWRDLYSARAFPFPNHYVVADSLTNHHRFYRLATFP